MSLLRIKFFSLIALFFAAGCTTPAKKPKRSKKSVAKHENMSLDLIVAEDGLLNQGKVSAVDLSASGSGKARKNKRHAEGRVGKTRVTQKQIASCEKLYDRFVMPYRNLAKALPPSENRAPTASLKVATLQRQSCSHRDERKSTIKAILSATDLHSQRIAVILPVSGPNANISKHIIDGFKASFAEAGLSFDRHVLIKDTTGAPHMVEQKLAEAIFVDQVSFVIGGITGDESHRLVKWSEPLFVPMLLFAQDGSITEDNAFAFRIYPDEKRLSHTIADIAQKNQLRRIAILRPASKKSDNLVEYFRQKVQENQGAIVYDLIYQTDDYDSMEFVTRQLFQLDIAKRGDDYRRAFYNARRRAQVAGMPFNPRNIVIDPIVEFDAVFVPDDFRIVRHFTKLFKYHGVRQIPMLGNHEWRSPALIQPPDEFLNGSYFADFIGSYSKLPPTIGAPTTHSPYFIKPDQVMPVDFRLIGYRAGYLGKMAVMAKVEKRRHIAPFFEKLPSNDQTAFGLGLVFDEDHTANWPTYVFRVGNGVLALDESHFAQLPHNTPQIRRASLFGKPIAR